MIFKYLKTAVANSEFYGSMWLIAKCREAHYRAKAADSDSLKGKEVTVE